MSILIAFFVIIVCCLLCDVATLKPVYWHKPFSHESLFRLVLVNIWTWKICGNIPYFCLKHYLRLYIIHIYILYITYVVFTYVYAKKNANDGNKNIFCPES